ncbi:MAG: hypothetical protein ABIR96_00655 [Bdellovibrionota bacterium]
MLSFISTPRYRVWSSMGIVVALSACNLNGRSFNASSTTNEAAKVPPRYLYVASGACYAGGVATATGLALISKYDLETGQFMGSVADFNRTATADFPADMREYDADTLMVLIENAVTPTYRRIDLVPKDGAHLPSTLTYGGGFFTGILRSVTTLADGTSLISRSGSVAKLDTNFVTGSPFINAPTGLCATSTTLISDMVELPATGKILFTHAGATPNNRLGLLSADGTTCLTGIAGPVTTSLATDMLMHSSGNVLVAYGSTVAGSNMIYTYTVDETLNTISGIQSYSNATYINGPTRMAEDKVTGDVYIANGATALSNIEKFHFNTATKALTRAQNFPYIQLSGTTRCVSGMVISE